MTIAACYVSSEGVVFGADSTATFMGSGSPDSTLQTYQFTQKVFEIGDSGSTLGFVSCGLQNVGRKSFRTMLAELSDAFIQSPPTSVESAAESWRDMFWSAYTRDFDYQRMRCRDLHSRPTRTEDEHNELLRLIQSLTGTCVLGGRVSCDRSPNAYFFEYGGLLEGPPEVQAIPTATPRFWGWPNLLERLQYGIEDDLFRQIHSSPHWNGTLDDLFSIIEPHTLHSPGELPIRDAIDWIHASIFVTIKAMKFSQLPSVCGGPIDVAVITTDRPFRWVRHKTLADAITIPGE